MSDKYYTSSAVQGTGDWLHKIEFWRLF
jgi:hypothetical protein